MPQTTRPPSCPTSCGCPSASSLPQSTVLWQEVRLDWDVCRVQAGETACARAAHWLLRRLPICRRLLLTGWPDFGAALQSGDSTPPLAQVDCSSVSALVVG